MSGVRDSDQNGTTSRRIWGGTYSNLYGYYVEHAIRRWGYVIWDAVRLERTGAEELLERQWKAGWGEDDPRGDTL